MPKICAIALTLICLVATVADAPGVSLFSGPGMTGEPPAATAPLEVVDWPHVALASDPTIAHPVEHATWAPLAMNAADALEIEEAREEASTDEFASGSVGGAKYDHPTLLLRIGASRRASGSRPGASAGGSGGSGPSVPNASGPTDDAPADGGSPVPPDDQPNAGNMPPEGPGDSAPPATEAPPSNTETPSNAETPSEAPSADDASPAPGEEPHEEPSDTPATPTYPSYPIDDVPGRETPIEVPEPSSLGLLGIGLAGLLARRRRRAN